MSTAELKQKLIAEISNTDDEFLLLEIYKLVELEKGDLSIYSLSDEQIAVVKESQQEVRRGKYLKEHDANKEIDEWLDK